MRNSVADVRKRERAWRTVGWAGAAAGLSCLVLFATSCSHPRPSADFSFQPAAPSVNELVYFSDGSQAADGVNDLIAWEWDFGDGGTATGQEAWHQFRSANSGSPWGVTLKVTDTAQNEGVKRKSVLVRGGEGNEACGYTVQRVGTACELASSARPSIPTASELPLHHADVWTSWWEAPLAGELYCLVQVYFPQFEEGNAGHRMDCLWTLYDLGERGDARPRLIKDVRSDSRQAEIGTAYAVGFPLQLRIEQDLATPGWYRVFADIQTGDGNRRTVVDFLVNAGGRPLGS